MPRTQGTRNSSGGRGYSKPKYGQGVNPGRVDPGFEGVWDLFQLLLDPGSTLFGAGGGQTDVAKSPTPPAAMTGPDMEMAVEGAHQTGDMAQQVAQWDPFKGTVPFVGGGQTPPPMPAQRPPMPQRGMMPPTQPSTAAAPPMPARNVDAQEQMFIDRGMWGAPPSKDPAADALEQQLIAQGGADADGNYGQFGYGSGTYPMNQQQADQLAAFFSMLARGM